MLYGEIDMDEWHVGDPADWGDSVGVPDIPYMGYLKDKEDEPPERPPNNKEQANILGKEAWKLYMDYRDEEALDLINEALSYDQRHSRNWNRKAIILEGLERYEDSLYCYVRSLNIKKSKIVIENKARMLKDWISILCDEKKDLERAMNLINQVIEELSEIQTEEDINQYRALKRRVQIEINLKNSTGNY